MRAQPLTKLLRKGRPGQWLFINYVQNIMDTGGKKKEDKASESYVERKEKKKKNTQKTKNKKLSSHLVS